MYELEHDVPIPPAGSLRRMPPAYDSGKYQWNRFDVGDSIFVPCIGLDAQQTVRMRLLASAGRYAKLRPGKKFTTRCEPRGVRIWRVA